MGTFTIVGTGMGSKDYMLSAGLKAIEEADILIGGERNLQDWLSLNKENIIIKKNLSQIPQKIKENYKEKKVVVLLSGDPGFYSLLTYLSRYFNRKEIKVIPALSSMQMAFAKVSLSWHDAVLLNLHGRNLEKIGQHLEENKIGLLTDPVNNPLEIIQFIREKSQKNFTVFICSNLGYNNESVQEFKIEDWRQISIDKSLPAVMILLDEEENGIHTN